MGTDIMLLRQLSPRWDNRFEAHAILNNPYNRAESTLRVARLLEAPLMSTALSFFPHGMYETHAPLNSSKSIVSNCSGNGTPKDTIPVEPAGKGSAATSRQSTKNVISDSQHYLENTRAG